MFARIALFLPLWALALLAQPVEYFPFNINQDALSGAPDFSFLNRPLTPEDRLFVRAGHFFRVGPDLLPNTDDDTRVRLFGVNLSFGANFPTESDAPRIARRLRRLGVNLVRFHHMDSSPDSNPQNANSILTTGPYPTFNPVTLPRLKAFLTALRDEGIYANINLHVGYAFRPSVDDIPALPGGIAFPSQSKPLHMLHPRMVEFQAAYVRGLFERLEMKGDPVFGVAELNNETSIIHAFQTASLDPYLIGDYHSIAATRWNQFLRERYTSIDALREAWGEGTPDGPDRLPAAWRSLEIHSGGSASMSNLADGSVRVQVFSANPSGAPTVILKKVGFSLNTTETLVAEVEIRADLPEGATRSVYWDIKQDTSPWRTVVSRTINVSNEWQTVRLTFTPAFPIENVGRFGLSLERCDATVYVRGARLFSGGQRGYAPDESLDLSTFQIVSSGGNSTEGRLNDYLDFLASLDREYNQTLLNAVRETNDELLPVAGTQMGYGGMMVYDSHRILDYYDEHFYIDHYHFPNTAWDGRDWLFRDSSAVAGLWSSFFDVAAARVANRPYTVSEFNQAWPNTYGAEIIPTLAAFASFQDWDSIMHFAYEHSRAWDLGVPHGFNLNGDWSKFITAGQAAFLFRTGLVAPALESITLPMNEAVRKRFTRERRNGAFTLALGNYFGYQETAALRHRVALDPDFTPDDAETALPDDAKEKPGDTVASDTGELLLDRIAKIATINAPSAAGVFGAIKDQRVAAGPLGVQLSTSARGFVSILLTALDAQPIPDSRRLLLSNPGYTLRSKAGSDPNRPEPIVLYRNQSGNYTIEPDQPNKPSGNLNSGVGPAFMERIEAHVSLASNAPSIAVYPLDGSGRRLDPIEVMKTNSGFSFTLNAPSPWYEIIVLD